jgi:hypothetical protein
MLSYSVLKEPRQCCQFNLFEGNVIAPTERREWRDPDEGRRKSIPSCACGLQEEISS